MPSSEGNSEGRMPWVKIWMRRAPVSASASIGAMSISSIVSANSRPSMPSECTASARPPGKRAEPDSGHEEQCPHQVGYGSGKADHPTRDPIKRPRRRCIRRGEHRQRQRYHNADHSAEQGDVDGFESRPKRRVKQRKIRRHRAPDDIGHPVDAGDQILGFDLDDDHRLGGDQEPGQSGKQAPKVNERAAPARGKPVRPLDADAHAAALR
jgi:hypothetical protein